MFTGIIEEVGSVRLAEGGVLVVACETVLDDTKLGDSIAVNGVDLTVRAMDGETLTFDVMAETFRRSNLAQLQPDAAVNLERSVTAATRLSGHIVRGVVETTCTLESLTPEGEAMIARYAVDPAYLRYIAMKGPVCVDGVSLTVMARDDRSFSVSIVRLRMARARSANVVWDSVSTPVPTPSLMSWLMRCRAETASGELEPSSRATSSPTIWTIGSSPTSRNAHLLATSTPESGYIQLSACVLKRSFGSVSAKTNSTGVTAMTSMAMSIQSSIAKVCSSRAIV